MAVFFTPGLADQDATTLTFPAALPPSVLTRLRTETQIEHAAVERVLDLMSTTLSCDAYRRRLEQFYGFYGPLEAALQIRCALPESGLGLSTSRLAALLPRLNKTALLRQDLHYLGVPTDGLLLCQHLPPLKTRAEVLGCMYVMEGATLGGRMITQHVQATLGVTPATGGRFFEGYAGSTGKMWQGMRQLLVAGAIDTPTENAMVASAVVTFASLRGWCQYVQPQTAAKASCHA